MDKQKLKQYRALVKEQGQQMNHQSVAEYIAKKYDVGGDPDGQNSPD